MLKKAFGLLWEDIKRMRDAAIVIFIYLIVSRKIFRISCPMVAITGFPCPGCGVTRACVSLVRGEFYKAFCQHAFVYVLIVYAVFFFVWRYLFQKDSKMLVRVGTVVLFLMIAYYIYRMIYVFPGEPPMSFYRHNLIQIIMDKL